MYNDTIWVNQSIYKIKDNECGTNSTLELAVTTKTSDNINFGAPEITFRLSSKISNTSHVCSLDYQNLSSLLFAINDIQKNPDLAYDQGAKIVRRIGASKDLVVMCALTEQGRYILIGIKNNESDSGKIIIKYETFVIISDLLINIKNNYINLAMELPKRLPDSNVLDKLAAIERAIRVLPTSISIPSGPTVSDVFEIKKENGSSIVHLKEDYPEELATEKFGTICSICGEPQFDTPSGPTCKNGHGGADGIEEDNSSSNEFEKFVDDNIDKVTIPELDHINDESIHGTKTSGDPPQQEYNSPFIYRVLNGSIRNYEALINTIYHDPNSPTQALIELIREKMGIDNFLPGISKKESKSLNYVSKTFFKAILGSYVEFGNPIPSSSPILLKYKPKNPTVENIELAYDLLLINTYIKAIRTTMEGKITDSMSNYATLHIASRCFTDVLVFSFIMDMNPDVIKNCVMSRYKAYKEKGFFSHMEEYLHINKFDQISDSQVLEILDLALRGAASVGTIIEMHDMAHKSGKLKIPSENNFTPEQMSNDIVKLEVARLLGKSLDGVINDEELAQIFSTTKPKLKTPNLKSPSYKSNIHRFVNEVDFIGQIPERHKESFGSHIEEISEASKDFDFDLIPPEELGDDVVKAIYVWNTCDKKERYTKFRTRIEECMSKDLIIAQVKGTKDIKDETGSDDAPWV